ncbi:MAG: hypothetical protein WC924_00285 [Candidatus Gracilibacteria bacterium]
MQQNCKKCSQGFKVTEEDLKYYQEISPVFGGKKYLFPAPTLCPACRQQRRMAYRNERSLYHRTCELCNKNILSVYSPDKPYTVYCKECWWSDKWDGMNYGQDFDFSRTFSEQFMELKRKIPKLSIINLMDENSDYTNFGYQNKDCYLVFTSDMNEKCYYGCFVWNSYECLDNLFLIGSNLCYECVDCVRCYASAFCQECESGTDCFGCFDCKSCQDCFGSSGLRNKQYYFFNKPLTKEEYEKRVVDAKTDWKGTLARLKAVGKDLPRRNLFLINCEDCLGDHLSNCKNATYCFDSKELEDSTYVTNSVVPSSNCFDIDGCGLAYWCYECISIGATSNHCAGIDVNWNNGNDLYYCSYILNSRDLFGCIGVNQKQYCILNKQYTKEEYEKLAARIIEHMKVTGEWGAFFPPELSTYGYNETVAQEYYPLTKDQALKYGFPWSDFEEPTPKLNTIKASALPKIADVTDDILKAAIECEVSGKPFRIIKQELDFYRKMGIEFPTKCHEVRHRERLKKRNPRKLWERKCDSCGTAIQTTYSPDRPEKVYCEKCYLKAVYGGALASNVSKVLNFNRWSESFGKKWLPLLEGDVLNYRSQSFARLAVDRDVTPKGMIVTCINGLVIKRVSPLFPRIIRIKFFRSTP